jgi:transcription elongation factor Elf1
MWQPHQPFSYIPLTNIAPIVCPDCGVKANFVTCLPHPEQLKAEIHTFTCKDCGKQSQMTVRN